MHRDDVSSASFSDEVQSKSAKKIDEVPDFRLSPAISQERTATSHHGTTLGWPPVVSGLRSIATAVGRAALCHRLLNQIIALDSQVTDGAFGLRACNTV